MAAEKAVVQASDKEEPVVVVSITDILKTVQVSNGGGPKYSIPMGVVVIAVTILAGMTQLQVRELAAAQNEQQATLKLLQQLQISNEARVGSVELAALKLADSVDQLKANVVRLSALQEADKELRSQLIEEWRILGRKLGDSR